MRQSHCKKTPRQECVEDAVGRRRWYSRGPRHNLAWIRLAAGHFSSCGQLRTPGLLAGYGLSDGLSYKTALSRHLGEDPLNGFESGLLLNAP